MISACACFPLFHHPAAKPAAAKGLLIDQQPFSTYANGAWV